MPKSKTKAKPRAKPRHKQKKKQSGLNSGRLALVVVAVVLIGLAGLKIFHLRGGSTAVGQVPTAQTDNVPSVQAPPGWHVFADKSIGVQFIYPDVYGEFRVRNTDSFKEYDHAVSTERLGYNYLPGVSSYFVLGSYTSIDAEIPAGDFGLTVRLDDDQWTVVKAGQSDMNGYNPGDVFPAIQRHNTRGLNVYTAMWIQEGITTYKLYFVTNGKLRVLQLPAFDSEQYTSTYNINDQAPYDAMYAQIRDSISLY
jgi:hypothetical protein